MTGTDAGDLARDEIEAGRVLFAQACSFMLGVVKMDGLPDEGPPEVAFALSLQHRRPLPLERA
jgi:GTP-binding protein